MWFAVCFFMGYLPFARAQDSTLAVESKQATALMSQGNYEAAIPLYKHLIHAVPGNPGLILDLGLAQQMAGHPKEAVPHFEAVLKAQPSNIPALSSLASCRLELSEPAQAIGPLQKLLVLDPGKRDTRGMLAGALMAVARFSDAAAQYRKLAATDDQDARAWYGLGSAYESLSASSFTQLEKVAPQSAYVLELVADSQASRAQYRSAFYFYRQAESKLPDLRGLHAGLAKVYLQTDHKDWAEQETLRESHLPRPDCVRAVKECQVLAGNFLDATKSNATGAQDLFWSVKAYNELALGSFEKLGHLPESAEIHALKATLFKQHRQYKQSSTEWKAAVQLDPRNQDLKRGLEGSLFLAQDYEALLPMLEHDIGEQAGSAEINFRLGECLLQMQQAEKALPYLEKSAQAANAPEAAHASLGLALMQVGRSRDAIPEFEKALKVDDTGSLHYQLARAYQMNGQAEKSHSAMGQYQQIQSMNQKQDETLSKEAQITAPEVH